MDDGTTTPQAATQRKFVVKLWQTTEIVTEQFEYDVDNKKDALQKAQNFIDDEKDLVSGKYRLEVVEIEETPTASVPVPSPE